MFMVVVPKSYTNREKGRFRTVCSDESASMSRFSKDFCNPLMRSDSKSEPETVDGETSTLLDEVFTTSEESGCIHSSFECIFSTVFKPKRDSLIIESTIPERNSSIFSYSYETASSFSAE